MKFKTRRSIAAALPLKNSPYRFYLGLLVGAITAFTTYAFLVCLREGVRMMNFAGPEYFWYFSQEELYFSSYVMAFFALQFGQLQCLQIWWQKPNLNPKKRYNYTLLAHDFKLNYWYFFYWFFALGFYYALSLVWTLRGGFYYTELYKNYAGLWIFALVVLQVNSFAAFRRILRSKVWRPFLISSLVTFGLAAILAFWQPANAQRMQKLNAQKDIFKNNAFQLPVSPLRSKDPFYDRVRVDVYYSRSHEIVYRYKAKTYTSSQAMAQALNADFNPNEWFRPALALRVDGRIRLNKLFTFLDQLEPSLNRKTYLAYASVKPKLPPILDQHYQRLHALAALAAWRDTLPKSEVNNRISLSLLRDSLTTISAQETLKAFTNQLYTQITQTPNYSLLHLQLDSSTTLGDYLLAKSAYYIAVTKKRNNYAQALFSRNLEDLSPQEKETCRQLYPMRFKLLFH